MQESNHLGLTPAESAEFTQLSKKLFNGAAFKSFTEKEEQSPAFLRYDVLMLRHLAACKQAYDSKIAQSIASRNTITL